MSYEHPILYYYIHVLNTHFTGQIEIVFICIFILEISWSNNEEQLYTRHNVHQIIYICMLCASCPGDSCPQGLVVQGVVVLITLRAVIGNAKATITTMF